MKKYIVKAATVRPVVGWVVRDIYKAETLDKAKVYWAETNSFLKKHFKEGCPGAHLLEEDSPH